MPAPGRAARRSPARRWLPPGWNQPYLHGRVEEDLCNSRAESYADRPAVAAPHVLQFMGMTPSARSRHMAAVAAQAGLP